MIDASTLHSAREAMARARDALDSLPPSQRMSVLAHMLGETVCTMGGAAQTRTSSQMYLGQAIGIASDRINHHFPEAP